MWLLEFNVGGTTITGQLQYSVINFRPLGRLFISLVSHFFIGKMRKFKKINPQDILPFQDPNKSVGYIDSQTFKLTLFPGLGKALASFVFRVTTT